eukprot:15314085-Alexandrium_andersonii.AAC.1
MGPWRSGGISARSPTAFGRGPRGTSVLSGGAPRNSFCHRKAASVGSPAIGPRCPSISIQLHA